MLSESDFLTWWNKPICWFFAILLSPIGLLFWLFDFLPILFRNRKRFFDMNHWVILSPGFCVGLFLSLAIASPFSFLSYKIKNSLYEKNFRKSESGKQHQAIVNEFIKIFGEMSDYIKFSKNVNTRISTVDDKKDRVTRIHLLGDNNLNIMVYIYWENNRGVSAGSTYFSKNNLDFDLLRSKLLEELDRELIKRT